MTSSSDIWGAIFLPSVETLRAVGKHTCVTPPGLGSSPRHVSGTNAPCPANCDAEGNCGEARGFRHVGAHRRGGCKQTVLLSPSQAIRAVDIPVVVGVAISVARPRAVARLPGEQVGAVDATALVEIGIGNDDDRIRGSLMGMPVVCASDAWHRPVIHRIPQQAENCTGVRGIIEGDRVVRRLPQAMLADL